MTSGLVTTHIVTPRFHSTSNREKYSLLPTTTEEVSRGRSAKVHAYLETANFLLKNVKPSPSYWTMSATVAKYTGEMQDRAELIITTCIQKIYPVGLFLAGNDPWW